jgi:salicylate hydroxylase
VVTPTGGILVNVEDVKTGLARMEGEYDLLVVADGRYSALRRQAHGRDPEVIFRGVCNFRVLVEDTSGGLFDDMELIYNTRPSLESLPPHLQADPALRHCFSGMPRVGIMRMPRSPTCASDSIYIFGNFPVQDLVRRAAFPLGLCIDRGYANRPVGGGGQVPEAAKSREVLRALFYPCGGKPDARAQFVLDVLEREAPNLHWARMQDIDFKYRDAATGRVLLLGDASHAMVPTLGQGATTALEDACVSAAELIRARRAGTGAVDVAAVTAAIEARCLPRVQLVSETSLKATKHLQGDVRSLEGDRRDWTQQGEGGERDREPSCFRRAIQDVWAGYPRGGAERRGAVGLRARL